MAARLTNLFWLWTILGVGAAWLHPPAFTWFAPYIKPGLGVIMLGMGITLSFADFRRVLEVPRSIAVGAGAQFLIMPLLGWGLAKAAVLSPEMSVGLILVSCCPGGTASNVIAYLARANVALSVLMTMTSTFLAVFLTPLLTKLLAGAYMDIDALGLLKSTAQVVLLPVVVGIALNSLLPARALRGIKVVSPLVSVVIIVLIVACIVGLRRDSIAQSALPLLTAIFVLHATGFGLGYLFARLLGYPETFRRTVSIEVGMQNSGLGATLAKEHFTPDTAVPSAISAFYHCLIGSLLAGIWRNRLPEELGGDGKRS